MDSRLMLFNGKELVKSPCVGECAGCEKSFKPIPFEGKRYCRTYLYPAVKWTGLNPEGEPKTCFFMRKPKAEKEQKINPAKASRRRIKQASPVTAVSAVTGSKESKKKK